jgi:lysophospholipase L1-like esterase
MRWIKKSLLLIPVIALLIALLFMKKEDKQILLLGDNKDISYCLKELAHDYKINDSLSLKTMKSKELLYYVSSNAYLNNENKKISINQLIKESKCVVISIGINDLLSKLILNKYESKLTYDLDNISLMLSLFEQNLFNIIEHILLVNESCKIIVTTYDDPFYLVDKQDEIHTILNKLNLTLISVCNFFEQHYVEIKLNNTLYYDDLNSFYPNDLGNQKIAEIIYQKIIAIN